MFKRIKELVKQHREEKERHIINWQEDLKRYPKKRYFHNINVEEIKKDLERIENSSQEELEKNFENNHFSSPQAVERYIVLYKDVK